MYSSNEEKWTYGSKLPGLPELVMNLGSGTEAGSSVTMNSVPFSVYKRSSMVAPGIQFDNQLKRVHGMKRKQSEIPNRENDSYL
jgi:hypothetical protein